MSKSRIKGRIGHIYIIRRRIGHIWVIKDGDEGKGETEGGGKEVMTTLVNTGFETERPQVLVPLNLARALSL